MGKDLRCIFGGRFHFQRLYQKHNLSEHIPLALIPINGYYFQTEGLEEFIQLKLRKYINNDRLIHYFNPIDAYTLQISCDQRLLTENEFSFCSEKISEFNSCVVDFNKRKDITKEIVREIISGLDPEAIFRYQLSDVPILDIPISNPTGLHSVKNFYNLNLKDILNVCPLLIEYLILSTTHFCIEDFDLLSANASSLKHAFLDVTFQVNEAKLAVAKGNHSFTTCRDFDMSRIRSIISRYSEIKMSIYSSCNLDDYDRPIGRLNRMEWDNARHWIYQYNSLLDSQ